MFFPQIGTCYSEYLHPIQGYWDHWHSERAHIRKQVLAPKGFRVIMKGKEQSPPGWFSPGKLVTPGLCVCNLPTPIKDRSALWKLSEDESSPRKNPFCFLQTDNRQPPAWGFFHHHPSSCVMESLPLLPQRTRRTKKQRNQVAGAERGITSPTMQPGCSPSQAVCWDSCLSWKRKRKEKQSLRRTAWPFILKAWKTAKHETEPVLKHRGAFLYRFSSILPLTTSWQFSSLTDWSTLKWTKSAIEWGTLMCTK